MTPILFNATSQAANYTIPTQSVHFGGVLADFCTQIHSKVVLAAVLLFAYFTFSIIVIPRARLGFAWLVKETPGLKHFESNIKWVLDRAQSLLETFGLGSTIFLLAIIHYQQGLTLGQKIALSVMVSLIVVAFMSMIVEKIRNRRAKA